MKSKLAEVQQRVIAEAECLVRRWESDKPQLSLCEVRLLRAVFALQSEQLRSKPKKKKAAKK